MLTQNARFTQHQLMITIDGVKTMPDINTAAQIISIVTNKRTKYLIRTTEDNTSTGQQPEKRH